MSDLNSGQQQAYDYLTKRRKGAFRIDGFAGTGKTYLAVKIIKSFLKKHPKQNVTVICPTHQAKTQFSSRLEEDSRITITTVASFLKQFPSKEKESGRLTFGVGGYNGHDCGLLIADEVSMNSNYETQEINKASSDCVVLHLGDLYQLRPVMKKGAADILGSLKTFQLTEQQRNAGPILEYVNKVRQSMDDKKIKISYPDTSIETLDGNGNVSAIYVHENFVDFKKHFLKRLVDAPNPYDVVYLAYTNASVNKMRVACHRALYGKKVFNKKQYIRLASPCEVGNNGNLCQILSIPHKHKRTVADITMVVYTLRLKCLETGLKGHAQCVSPRNQKVIEARLEELYKLSEKAFKRDSAMYEHYQWCIEELRQFALLRSPFSSTIHNSQGRSIPEVYVDTRDIAAKGTDKKRLTYVGASRPQFVLNTIRVNPKNKVGFGRRRK